MVEWLGEVEEGRGLLSPEPQMKEPPAAAPQVGLVKPLLRLSTAQPMIPFSFSLFFFVKGGVKAGEKMRFGGGVSGGTGIRRRDLEDDDRRTGCGNKHGDDHCQQEGEDIGVKRRRRKRWRRTSPPHPHPPQPRPPPLSWYQE